MLADSRRLAGAPLPSAAWWQPVAPVTRWRGSEGQQTTLGAEVLGQLVCTGMQLWVKSLHHLAPPAQHCSPRPHSASKASRAACLTGSTALMKSVANFEALHIDAH